MLELYPQIKTLHVWLITVSGLLFAMRGAAALAGMHWPRNPVVRYTSHIIDTFLLTTAAMLVTILPHGMFANGWLAVKLLLLVLYIVLGIFAMHEKFNRSKRAIFYILALATFASIIGIARLHSPWGWLAPYVH